MQMEQRLLEASAKISELQLLADPHLHAKLQIARRELDTRQRQVEELAGKEEQANFQMFVTNRCAQRDTFGAETLKRQLAAQFASEGSATAILQMNACQLKLANACERLSALVDQARAAVGLGVQLSQVAQLRVKLEQEATRHAASDAQHERDLDSKREEVDELKQVLKSSREETDMWRLRAEMTTRQAEEMKKELSTAREPRTSSSTPAVLPVDSGNSNTDVSLLLSVQHGEETAAVPRQAGSEPVAVEKKARKDNRKRKVNVAEASSEEAVPSMVLSVPAPVPVKRRKLKKVLSSAEGDEGTRLVEGGAAAQAEGRSKHEDGVFADVLVPTTQLPRKKGLKAVVEDEEEESDAQARPSSARPAVQEDAIASATDPLTAVMVQAPPPPSKPLAGAAPSMRAGRLSLDDLSNGRAVAAKPSAQLAPLATANINLLPAIFKAASGDTASTHSSVAASARGFVMPKLKSSVLKSVLGL